MVLTIKEEVEDELMKIIDCEIIGNSVRFYMGADDLKDWGGDDWDDTPYEHNCGPVLFNVEEVKDVHFPLDALVLEPCNGVSNSNYCRDDFKERKVPCVIVVPEEVKGRDWHDDFAYWAANEDPRILRFYFGDNLYGVESGSEYTENGYADTILKMIRAAEGDELDALTYAYKCMTMIGKIKKTF